MTVYQVCLHLSSSNTQPKQVVNGDGRDSRATGVPALVGKKDSYNFHCVWLITKVLDTEIYSPLQVEKHLDCLKEQGRSGSPGEIHCPRWHEMGQIRDMWPHLKAYRNWLLPETNRVGLFPQGNSAVTSKGHCNVSVCLTDRHRGSLSRHSRSQLNFSSDTLSLPLCWEWFNSSRFSFENFYSIFTSFCLRELYCLAPVGHFILSVSP